MSEQGLEALAQLSDGLAAAAERGARSTVQVNARRRLPASGVVWSADGVIVTADHVIERDDEISVGLPDGSQVAATLAGRDPGSDLAVLRAEASGLEAAALAPEGDTKVGHLVLALGRPARGGAQASFGVVSAVGGAWRTFRGGQVEGYLRPDLVFYPGFSGGPLVDAHGRVAGVNSSRLRRGSGLSIPSAAVDGIATTLLEQGRIRRGYLGVASQPARLPEALAGSLDGQDTGLLIVSVESGSPADGGGLIVGDILVRFEDLRLEDHSDLQAALGAERVGTQAKLLLLRGGESQELTIAVGERG